MSTPDRAVDPSGRHDPGLRALEGAEKPDCTQNPHVTRELGCGWRLPFQSRQRGVDASPTWRTGRPDRHRRLGEIRIVERSCPHEYQVRSRLGLTEKRSAAFGAKPAVHTSPAIGHAREVARPSDDPERFGAKARANRSASRAEVLAIAAPAHARGDRRFRALPAHRAAQALSRDCHGCLQAGIRWNGESYIRGPVSAGAHERSAGRDCTSRSPCRPQGRRSSRRTDRRASRSMPRSPG